MKKLIVGLIATASLSGFAATINHSNCKVGTKSLGNFIDEGSAADIQLEGSIKSRLEKRNFNFAETIEYTGTFPAERYFELDRKLDVNATVSAFSDGTYDGEISVREFEVSHSGNISTRTLLSKDKEFKSEKAAAAWVKRNLPKCVVK